MTVAVPDPAPGHLGEDLRTAVALLTGSRLADDTCRRLVAELFEGEDSERHQAVALVLLTHLLALGDRPAVDQLAWRWLSARHSGQGWTIRRAADVVKLAVFWVESGWRPALLRRLVVLVAQSRGTPVWVDLTDLARAGGRHAAVLRPLVFRADLWDPADPVRQASLQVLANAHELHHMSSRLGDGFAIVGHAAADVRTATLFTRRATPSARALVAAREFASTRGLFGAVHVGPGGVRHLPEVSHPRVIALRPLGGQEIGAGPGRLTAPDSSSPLPANLPAGMALPVDAVLSVFPAGPSLARRARWVAAGQAQRQAR